MGRCDIPRGREVDVMTKLPVIPPGLSDDFLAGRGWPNGIQQGLDRTRDCPWVPDMAQVRESAVIIGGQLARLATPVLGGLPWGWYKWLLAGGTPQPPDPAVTLVHYREAQQYAQRVTMPQLGEAAIVPTIDLLLPWPFYFWRSSMALGFSNIQAGALGCLIWRIPGTLHPLYSTGLAIGFVVPEFLSSLGRSYVDALQGRFYGQPGSYLVPPFSAYDSGVTLSCNPYQVTRHFQASHMQRTARVLRNPDGTPASWRWRIGGARPSPGTVDRPDVFEVRHGGLWSTNPLNIRQLARNVSGVLLETLAPEWPIGTNQVHGPAPGSFLQP